MKLKLKAEPRDVVIFIIFCIVLFFVVGLCVINALCFINEGTLKGINIFLIFTEEYFAPTMVFYLAALIAVFTSVSSYFFEREKGIGIEIGKKSSDGYSRWATDREMKKQLKKINYQVENCEHGGIPIINNGKELWVDSSGFHNMIIGSTGSGKSQSISFPFIRALAKAGESMIITDPKGELYEGTVNELKERGYNIVLLNFREPQKGNCWNPFSVPYKLYKSGDKDKGIELLEDLAKNILYDEKNKGNDPFWENTSADYFAGLGLSLFEDAEEEQVNINSINLMATVGEEKLGATNYIKEYFSTKDPTSTAYIKAKATVTAPNETKGSILSVFNQKIQLFSSRDNLSEMLSYSDFDMEDIGRKKTAVFIVIQDEKKTYHSLVTIFLKQCYETLVRVAQEQPGFKLKYRTNFILDEFANMPPLSDVDAMVSAARSRNIKLSFIIQNFSQLNDVYGKEKAETIRGNCGNTIFLLSTELAALEEISKMCGEVKSKKDDKTASRPLVTVTDLQNLKEEQGIILRSRMRPYKTSLKFDHKINWGKTYPKADYPIREKREVHLFDLKSKVEEERKKKIDDLINNGGLPNMPSMPGMPPLPGMPPFPGLSPMSTNTDISRPSMPFENNKSNNSLDDLVKRIDAKIAELEEEERREKEALAQKEEKDNKPSESVVIEENDVEPSELNIPTEPINNLGDMEPFGNTPISNNATEKSEPIEKETISTNDITDDQFFDDFFNDDDY